MPTTDGQDNHASIHGQSPNNALQRQISLGKRAPAEPIPERTWKFNLDVSKGLYSYEYVLSQRNQCIRSQRGYTKAHFEGRDRPSPSVGITREDSFPYPAEFRRLAKLDEGHDIEIGGAKPPAERFPNEIQTYRAKEIALTYRLFGISRTSVRISIARALPVYVVLGIFPRGQPNPVERIMFCNQPKRLFRKLGWEILFLRGFWKTFFSLRHVKGFRLYKVSRLKPNDLTR